QMLFEELQAGDREDQVAFRNGQRYVARLVPAGHPVELRTTARGALDNLTLERAVPRPPGPGQVQIRVHSTALNFLDALDALGALPFDRDGFGEERSGTVTAVGAGVDEFAPGEAVVALAHGSFSSSVTTLAELVAPKPPRLSDDEAAALPVAF